MAEMTWALSQQERIPANASSLYMMATAFPTEYKPRAKECLSEHPLPL